MRCLECGQFYEEEAVATTAPYCNRCKAKVEAEEMIGKMQIDHAKKSLEFLVELYGEIVVGWIVKDRFPHLGC